MPDIDIDFAVDGRERVINYVPRSTAATASPRSSRSGRWPPAPRCATPAGCSRSRTASSTRIAKLIPEGPGQTLATASSRLRPQERVRHRAGAKEIIDLAKPLEGLIRQDSIHAAGVVIGAEPLIDVVPLQQKGPDQEVVTQFSMNTGLGARPAEDGLSSACATWT
jgi:DNA polymerase-3 subunit alpha